MEQDERFECIWDQAKELASDTLQKFDFDYDQATYHLSDSRNQLDAGSDAWVINFSACDILRERQHTDFLARIVFN